MVILIPSKAFVQIGSHLGACPHMGTSLALKLIKFVSRVIFHNLEQILRGQKEGAKTI